MVRILAIACVALVGCSVFAVRDAPRTPQPGVAPVCDSSNRVPYVDLVAGGVFVGGGIALYALLEARAPNATDAGEVRTLALGAAVVGAVYAIAGFSGLGKTRRCRAAKAAAKPT